MTQTEFRLTVNGTERSVTCEPDTPLLDVLRHDLGLTGPRFGCGMGLCGACMVLIEGQARSSCDLPVSAVGGPVITVEGLPAGGRLHPVQQAFIDEQAAQCGYCTSGMVIAAAGLLRERPAPAEQEVREALDGNLCRCGAQGRIIRAVLKAAGRAPDGPAAVRHPPAGQFTTTQPPAQVPSGRLPADLAANPVLARWLDFSRDGEVTIRVGKVEYGQGIWTALAQIAAEELQVGLAQVQVAPVSTSTSPDEGVTAGSLSVQDSGSALRQACAQARGLLLAAAAAKLGTTQAALDVADGQIRTADGPAGLSYWTLAQPGALDRPAEATVYRWEAPDTPEPPSVAARRMWYDTVGHGHVPALRCAIDSFGADRLLLGTDFPYENGDTFLGAVDYINDPQIDPTAARAILDQNASALLGIG